MALNFEDIAGHSALGACIQAQTRAMQHAYQGNPRASSVFATQQRWLMAHIGLALHFRRDPSDYRKEMTAARFVEITVQHRVASRNTAHAFIKEMQHYNFVEVGRAGDDGRIRPLQVPGMTLEPLIGWIHIHLSTLDALDGGQRLETFQTQPQMLAKLQPLIADGLISSVPVREPQQTFSLFTWLNNGGVVMDWLISGVDPATAGQERIPTGVLSVGDFAKWLKLSRTHLARKLRDAEALGSVGWLGQRGNSVMWISNAFYGEYVTAQAVKLAIIDAAFAASQA
ncbi:hypothetical protein FJ987_27300 [Mesorhizobium sp. CU2]|uniref:hypothetical protein n=1 Tax=unclassified Mesorhizobium TaxID=325217 RepID=UPI001128F513|nr:MULTISPECIES: hypothetical protein [unclassified Mesorhizobium]TPN82603.1 hypothetical protein FJ988_15760 [Mesorhizobium sp. CU3]TPO04158.1 hypothetical protein FJ987_27300 [Mesorhizobium sp. CU2]